MEEDVTTGRINAKDVLEEPAAEVTSLSKIYTYLWQKKKGQLREICTVWNLKLGRNKLALIFQCLMLLCNYEKKETDIL